MPGWGGDEMDVVGSTVLQAKIPLSIQRCELPVLGSLPG